MESSQKKKKKGCFVTIPTGLFFLVLFIAGCVAVGLTVWFAIPRKKCAAESDGKQEALMESCSSYIEQIGKDTFCAKSPEVLKMEEEEKKQKEEIERKEISAEERKKQEEKMRRQEEERQAAEKAAALRTGLRLNKTLLPYHYDLSLWPHFYDGDDYSFTGNVTIHFTCKEETDVIVLHADQITVHQDQTRLTDFNLASKKISRVEEDVPRHFYKVYPEMRLMKNINYTLEMSFNGTLLHGDFFGFHRNSYRENNKTNFIAVTQFGPTAARRAFPLFDENFFKATFSVTLMRKKDWTALSNTELMTTEVREGGWYADSFQKTPIMAPYTLAFAITQYVYLERFTQRGTRVRIYASPAKIKYAEYANNVTVELLEELEKWTGLPYQLSKFDQILIPNFYFSMMDNWGLATYKDLSLLYNPDYSQAFLKEYVATNIGHLISHSWFGNLVTCRWWDDFFLHEGYGDYFGIYGGLKTIEPTYKVDGIYLRWMRKMLEIDGSHTGPPVRVPGIEHHEEVPNAFGWTTYIKGSSILRMIRDFLGPETFQKGSQRYLRDNTYKTVVDEDLYKALQTQAEIDGVGTWDTQKTNLSGILRTWVDQQNFPLLHVTDMADGSLKVTQSHFLYDQDQKVSFPTPLGSEFLWDIPLRWTDSTMKTNFTWMLREKEVRLYGVQRYGWKYLNPGWIGFYRVRYSDENWNAILYQLMQNHTVFPVESRAQFIDDAFHVARAGQMEEVDALRSTQYLKYERDYLPWLAAVNGQLALYKRMFYGKPAYDQLMMYLRNLVLPLYNVTGWTVPMGQGVLATELHSTIVAVVCSTYYEPCVEEARRLYDRFMNNPEEFMIPIDVRREAYCIAVDNGGIREWEFMKGRHERDYGDVFIALEGDIIKQALVCATKPNVIRKYLDYALAQNSTGMFNSIATRPKAKDTVWSYMIEHWGDFVDGNTIRIHMGPVLTSLTSSWSTGGELKKLKDFMMTHNETGMARTYNTIMAKIEDNKQWMDANMAPIENWLKAANSGQS